MYKMIVKPHLGCDVQAWALLTVDVVCLARVQWLTVERQKGKSCTRRLDDLSLYSMVERRFRGNMTEGFKILKGLMGLQHWQALL